MKKLILISLVLLALLAAFIVGVDGASAQEDSACRVVLMFPILPVLDDYQFLEGEAVGAVYAGEVLVVEEWFTDFNFVGHFIIGDWLYVHSEFRPEIEGWIMASDYNQHVSFIHMPDGVTFEDDCEPLEIQAPIGEPATPGESA